jgi:hypothetical protein
MRRFVLLSVIFLEVYVSVSCAGQPMPSPEITTPTVTSFVLPPAWTTTPSMELSTGTISFLSPAATETITSSVTPALGHPTSISSIIPITPVFDAGSDTFIAFVNFDWIYAANLAGETTQLWFLGSDDLVYGDVLHLEISPDRKYLAFSGIGVDTRPALEVLSLDSLQVIDREIFEGTRISDFTWSPNSRSILATVVTLKTHLDFDTKVYRMDPTDGPTRTTVLSINSTAIAQIEWLSPDRVVYQDFTCQNAVSVDLGDGYPQIIGRTGVGLMNLQTNSVQQKAVADDVDYWGSQIVLSPDGTKLVFLGIIQATGASATNLLFSTTNLSPLSCPFCHGYADLDWAKGFLLGDSSMVGIPGGSVYLLNETGGARGLLQYENQVPNSRIYITRGITAWIDYQSAIVSDMSITVSDIQACLPGNADMNSCVREMWNIEGQWPDGYNEERSSMDIYCYQ